MSTALDTPGAQPAARPDDDESLPGALTDSRRLTGANLFADEPGAVIDTCLPDNDERADALLAAWERHAAALLRRLDLPATGLRVRRHLVGAHCFMPAPIDLLLTATEINEVAWAAAEREVRAGRPHAAIPARDAAASAHEARTPRDTPSDSAFAPSSDTIARLRVAVEHDRRPRLVALAAEAARRERIFLFDDDIVSVGAGPGSLAWPAHALPLAADVPWNDVHDIPVALITGSNGKTTTTRLLGAMARAAGHTPGWCSTGGVHIAGEVVAGGDWAGPIGARRVLRDARTTFAVLETARGGMLRRGLAVSRADAAIVTNVRVDHFGEYGIDDLHALGEAKLMLARTLRPGGTLVLNADDATLRDLAPTVRRDITLVWFTLDPSQPFVHERRRAGEVIWSVVDGAFARLPAGATEPPRPAGGSTSTWDASRPLLPVAESPITLGGAARHNIANALGAIALASALELPRQAVIAALATFGANATDNPGRLVCHALEDTTAIVDFAHNPDGLAALLSATASLPAARRLLVLGQAGDRGDESLRELAECVADARVDFVVLKEMTEYLRGRELGEVPGVLHDSLRARGWSDDRITHADEEIEAVRMALRLAQAGDLLLLTVHSDPDAVNTLLEQLAANHWRAGQTLPARA